MIVNWTIMTIYISNSSIFIRILPEYFPITLAHLKRSFHSKNQNLLKKSLSSILFAYWCRPSIFRSNTPFWRSNTALDGPLMNVSFKNKVSNRLFLSGYTIMSNNLWYWLTMLGTEYSLTNSSGALPMTFLSCNFISHFECYLCAAFPAK